MPDINGLPNTESEISAAEARGLPKQMADTLRANNNIAPAAEPQIDLPIVSPVATGDASPGVKSVGMQPIALPEVPPQAYEPVPTPQPFVLTPEATAAAVAKLKAMSTADAPAVEQPPVPDNEMLGVRDWDTAIAQQKAAVDASRGRAPSADASTTPKLNTQVQTAQTPPDTPSGTRSANQDGTPDADTRGQQVGGGTKVIGNTVGNTPDANGLLPYETQTTSHGARAQDEKAYTEATDASAKAGAIGIAERQQRDALVNKKNAEALGADKAMLARMETDRLHNEMVLNKAESEVNDAVKEYQNFKLDSGRWFADQNMLGKAFAVLGLISGGMGQAMVGGDNHALKILTDAVDRDIRMQEHELTQKRGVVDIKNTVYSNMRARFSDATAAARATRAATLERFAREAEVIGKTVSDPAKQAELDKFAADAKTAAAKDKMHVFGWTSTTISKRPEKSVGKPVEGTLKEQSTYEQTLASLDQIKQDYNALPAAEKGKVADLTAKVKTVLGIPDPTRRAVEIENMYSSLRAAHPVFGTLSKNDQAMVISLTADMGSTPAAFNAAIDQTRKSTARDYQVWHNIHSDQPGVKPIGTGYSKLNPANQYETNQTGTANLGNQPKKK